MAKKKEEYTVDVVITSADQAQELSEGLPSIWSKESLLSQRTLIYIAKLLEEQNALLALLSHRASPKKAPTLTPLEAWLQKWFGKGKK